VLFALHDARTIDIMMSKVGALVLVSPRASAVAYYRTWDV
jgi:hypothetical protein